MKQSFNISFAKMIDDYLINPDNYVFPFEIHEKNKVRTIITYKKDENGYQLRVAHTFLKDYLAKLYESNDSSYAYKEGVCCLDAVKPHLKSRFFIKFDIHSFFESIKEDDFIAKHQYLMDHLQGREKEKGILNLRSAFYKGHLSIGYVTSPIISDIFLSSFDKEVATFMEKNKKLHYSRYSDDILISYEGNNWTDLDELFFFIVKELEKYGLSLNEKKTKREELSYDKKNSLTFLGLVLSKDEKGHNKITISKRFILFTLQLLDKYYKQEEVDNHFLRGTILSRLAYLQNNAPISYQRFLKKHLNKFNKEYKGI